MLKSQKGVSQTPLKPNKPKQEAPKYTQERIDTQGVHLLFTMEQQIES
jgi:hypothetical protein